MRLSEDRMLAERAAWIEEGPQAIAVALADSVDDAIDEQTWLALNAWA